LLLVSIVMAGIRLHRSGGEPGIAMRFRGFGAALVGTVAVLAKLNAEKELRGGAVLLLAVLWLLGGLVSFL